MNYFKLSLAFCISLLLLSCNNQKQNTELSAERRLLDTFFMQARFDNNDYPDETITLSPKDTNSNEYIERTFYVLGGITDIREELKDTVIEIERFQKLYELNNVEVVSCLVFRGKCVYYERPHYFPTFSRELKNLGYKKIKPGGNAVKFFDNNWRLYALNTIAIDIDSSLRKFKNIKKGIFNYDSLPTPIYPAQNEINVFNEQNKRIVQIDYAPEGNIINSIGWNIDHVKMFKIKLLLPKVYSDYMIRFGSKTNRILQILNYYNIDNKFIRCGNMVFRKKHLERYLDNLYAELKQCKVPYFRLNKSLLENVRQFTVFRKQLETIQTFFCRSGKIDISNKISIYKTVTELYHRSMFPKLYYPQSFGFVDFCIRVSEY